MKVSIKDLDFDKGNGLIPTVVQDVTSRKVLMLAYVNATSLKKTFETGYAHYWSRSRKTLWKKGGTSGHVQKIKKILVDCDEDTLLFLVHQTGNACHKDQRTCFHNDVLQVQT
ncbi:MAG: phosphoribosyl-AMP cyclohydrolase [Candidatus Bathyarchaeia archaeon]